MQVPPAFFLHTVKPKEPHTEQRAGTCPASYELLHPSAHNKNTPQQATTTTTLHDTDFGNNSSASERGHGQGCASLRPHMASSKPGRHGNTPRQAPAAGHARGGEGGVPEMAKRGPKRPPNGPRVGPPRIPPAWLTMGHTNPPFGTQRTALATPPQTGTYLAR